MLLIYIYIYINFKKLQNKNKKIVGPP